MMEENKNSIRLTEHYVSHSLFDTKTTNILDGLDLAYCNTNDITDMENEIAAQIISNSKSKSVDSGEIFLTIFF